MNDRPRKIPKKPAPAKRSHKRKPVTDPMVESPPPVVVPPLHELHSNEADEPTLSPPKPMEKEEPKPPFWHSDFFIAWVVVIVVSLVGAYALWRLTP